MVGRLTRQHHTTSDDSALLPSPPSPLNAQFYDLSYIGSIFPCRNESHRPWANDGCQMQLATLEAGSRGLTAEIFAAERHSDEQLSESHPV
jgi:hypothetical protein